MAAIPDQNTVLAQFLTNCRNQCLTHYVNLLQTRGMPFVGDDILVDRVRGGAVLDALIDGLRRNQMDGLGEFFQENARQLLSAGYNFDQIKIMYDLIEESVTVMTETQLNNDGINLTFRSLKSAFQLARMIAVNQYMSQFNSSFGSTIRSNSTQTHDGQFNPPPARSNTPALNGNGRLDSQSNNLFKPIGRSGRGDEERKPLEARLPVIPRNSTEDTLVGFLEWPLRVVPGSRPPEYYVHLNDGTLLQALLVDSTDAYTRKGMSFNKTLKCRIRQIGPVVLAYPL